MPDIKETTIIRLLETGDERCMKMMFDTYYQALCTYVMRYLISVEDAEISEMPFEWYVTMKNHLWWKLEKTIHVHESAGLVPEYLRISPEAIVLLRTDH